jgi:two-component system chemotaxis family response regulator WspR
VLTDPLTGLANRRHFDQTLASEWDRAARGKHPLAVIMIDIDHFKAFNDSRGHAAGDECLKAVAKALRGHCARPGDLVCRWGGEEFAVILPGTDLAGAEHVAGELADVVRGLTISGKISGEGARVTVSIGVASIIPGSNDSAHALMERADGALYSAKRAGRDRVRCAT